MVEVAGVEPASLGPSQATSTCLVTHLISLGGRDVTRYRFASIRFDGTTPGRVPLGSYAC